ncbi:hypothetical protein CM49_01289 [Paenibacillus sp. P1XP2]|nr:hypothetical protein CM49_01289 [Paenibacillus sp. P1XP2]
MVIPHHVADGFGGFAVCFVRRIAGFVHGVQNAPLHGLKPVADVGNGAVLNDIFGIPAEAVADDLFEISRQKLF